MGEVHLIARAPTPKEYATLRAAAGWAEVAPAQVERGLSHALYSVCGTDADGAVVGCARVIGDAGIYLYIQDVIVLPGWRGRGVGRRLMDDVMDYVASVAGSNTFVGLMAARGVREFYYRYGFVERPGDRPGMYRMW